MLFFSSNNENVKKSLVSPDYLPDFSGSVFVADACASGGG